MPHWQFLRKKKSILEIFFMKGLALKTNYPAFLGQTISQYFS